MTAADPSLRRLSYPLKPRPFSEPSDFYLLSLSAISTSGTGSIRKKSGKPRLISAPPYQIKILQCKLNHILQLVYEPKPPVHGFVKKRSTVTNAQIHVKKHYVLNLDLQDFFPSINFGRVRGAFNSKPFRIPLPAATVLAQLCCENGKLPQGAPTSPTASNIVCAKLDGDLWTFAQRNKCNYTRYCDDITLSTNLREFPDALGKVNSMRPSKPTLSDALVSVIENNGFKINQSKVRLLMGSQHQEVTGLTVNDFPNVPRKLVRQVRAMLYAAKKFGMPEAQREFHEKYDRRQRYGGNKPSFDQVLLGKLAYIQMVKGETDRVYRRLRRWLHEIDPKLIEDIPYFTAPEFTVWSALYEKYKQNVLQVEVRKENGEISGGSAFIIDDDVMVTSAHCLEGDVYISPWFEKEPIPRSEMIIHNQAAQGVDVAIIRTPKLGIAAQVKMGIRMQPVQPGEEVAIMGYPAVPQRQSALTITPGIVRGVTPTYKGNAKTLLVDIQVSGGMSGGPVFDRRGNLVGITIERTFASVREGIPIPAFDHILPVEYVVHLLNSTSNSGIGTSAS